MKVNVEVKVKILKRFKLMLFMLKVLVWLGMMNSETAAKIVCRASRRGWMAKYRIANREWRRIEGELTYTAAE